jgi:hypothetical protein
MNAQILAAVVGALLRILTPDLLKRFADLVLDFIETKVAGTASPVDDAIVLPLCGVIRGAFGIEDKDEV